MIKAIGYSLTSFDPRNPGRLCRGRERWVDQLPMDEAPEVQRFVVSGATFSDDSARDATRGLAFAEVGVGALMEAMFPDAPLLAFCEQGEPSSVPDGAVMVERHAQPRFGGRRLDLCVRWRVPCQGEAEVDALVGDGLHMADGFVPYSGELSRALEDALFLLTGFGERLELPARRFQPAAVAAVLQEVPWLACLHLDKHGVALGVYSREPLPLAAAVTSMARSHHLLAVPFSIPPMLARWDRALHELRMSWDEPADFPVPPAAHRIPPVAREQEE